MSVNLEKTRKSEEIDCDDLMHKTKIRKLENGARNAEAKSQIKSTNISYHKSNVNLEERKAAFASSSQPGCTIWFTGLSCSGKTTISFALEEYLIKQRNVAAYCLDGDNIRHGLNSNLGFSPDDRSENIRRIGEVSKLFADSGLVCLTAFISPYHSVTSFSSRLFPHVNINSVGH